MNRLLPHSRSYGNFRVYERDDNQEEQHAYPSGFLFLRIKNLSRSIEDLPKRFPSVYWSAFKFLCIKHSIGNLYFVVKFS